MAMLSFVHQTMFDFHVYRVMLSRVSPMFKHMFQSPKPASTGDDPQLVPMDEPLFVVCYLLQLCYPMDEPVVQPLNILHPVLAALIKYQMDVAKRGWMKRMLTLAAETDPWGAYAVALSLGRKSIQYQMTDEVRLIARASLRFDIGGPDSPEPALINGADYHRLLQYHQRCKAHILKRDVLNGMLQDVGSDWIWNKHCCDRSFNFDTPYKVLKAAWFSAYWDKIKLELGRHPSGEAVKAQSWIEEVLKLIDTCPTCAKAAVKELPLFVRKMFVAIENEISKIDFRYPE